MTSFQDFLVVTSSYLGGLHDVVMLWLFVIVGVVLMLFWHVYSWKTTVKLMGSSMKLEVIWTLIPILILASVASPSLLLLCKQDLYSFPSFSIKLISSQWSWQSEQPEVVDHTLDLESLDELGGFSTPLLVPFSVPVRVLLTSSDVLHSLGVSSLGVKLDSIPGRLNAVNLELKSLGLIVGSCYELCGSGHSAMPIYMMSC